MNVIVSNRQKEIIDNANIDAIKDLNGLFNVSDLINKFKNYFFSKMILDATSVVDFASRDVLTTLANEIGAEKLIILLPSSPEPPLEFKKLLVELKIYNFTNNIEDVVRFIEKPNTYEDAVKLIDGGFNNDAYTANSMSNNNVEVNNNSNFNVNTNNGFNNNNYNNNDTSSMNNQALGTTLGDALSSINLSAVGGQSFDNNTNNFDSKENNNGNFGYQNNDALSMAQNNMMMPQNNMMDNALSVNSNIDYNVPSSENNMGNDNSHVFLLSGDFNNMNSSPMMEKPPKMVIGFKNITPDAGSTSLIYMLHKMLVVNAKKNVKSIEIGKNDFRLFRDSRMISVGENEAMNAINSANEEIVLVDLNESNNFDVCSDVLFLVEPSTIKLNYLMATNQDIFRELRNRKVILNKSLLSSNDIRTLESEAGLSFFDVIEPLNDRLFSDSISKLINLLGIK